MNLSVMRAGALLSLLSLAACSEAPPQVLGTLEWDRITLPAPVAERIVRIDVREGEVVAAGAPLLQLELTRSAAQAKAATALARQSRDAHSELQAGARSELLAETAHCGHQAQVVQFAGPEVV